MKDNNKKTVLKYARSLASVLRREVTEEHAPDVGVILGTGWGDCLKLKDERNRSLSTLDSRFADLEEAEGHQRVVSYGTIGKRRVIALRGRIHLNEHPNSAELPMHVRLQVQMLLELGVRTFILTNAAGSLRDDVRVGNIVVADGFVTLFAPDMPLFGDESRSPEDILSPELCALALKACPSQLHPVAGGYAMVRGPQFEGRKYDKPLLRLSNAACVGMSTVPEACLIALYGGQALSLSFITNDAFEVHSHETNQARAKEKSKLLGEYLAAIIRRLP